MELMSYFLLSTDKQYKLSNLRLANICSGDFGRKSRGMLNAFVTQKMMISDFQAVGKGTVLTLNDITLMPFSEHCSSIIVKLSLDTD